MPRKLSGLRSGWNGDTSMATTYAIPTVHHIDECGSLKSASRFARVEIGPLLHQSFMALSVSEQ